MKIAVLAGGISTERKVSIVSGTMVCRALQEKGHQAILLDVFCGREDADPKRAFEELADVEADATYMNSFNDCLDEMRTVRRDFFGPKVLELCREADVVFLALHGENGENGKVQACFDLMGIPYTGANYISSAIAMDKAMTKTVLTAKGVPMPGGVTLKKGEGTYRLPELGMELPVVVKTCCGGSSVGVYITRTQEEYDRALEEAFALEDQVLVEEYISGREFSVGVVAGEAYPVIEIAPKEGFYDYKNKYQPGATVETCPAELTPEQTEEMQKYACMGCEALGITSYARLDFLMREDGRMYCLEANTLPGMTDTSLLPQEAQAVGISYPELCQRLIEVSLQEREQV